MAETLAKFGPNDRKYYIFNIPSENLYSRIPVPAYL